MSKSASGQPTIVLPYPGPADDPKIQDIFVYLRPETNGVLVESTLFRTIKRAGLEIDLVFMANLPGEFIVKNKIIEQYYAVKLHFAVQGKRAFTRSMRERLSTYFQIDFEKARILGAFEALQVLGLSPEELFHTWVADQDMILLNGQSVKRIKDLFIINYDIPALLHKNTKGTDIAVMMFRTPLSYQELRQLVKQMWESLVQAGILNPKFDSSRAFHHSKSPFEQTLDAISCLYVVDKKRYRLRDFTFPRYLIDRGVPEDVIGGLIMNPLVLIQEADGRILEDSIYSYANNYSFEEAYELIHRIVAQYPLIHHGPLIKEICRA